MGEMRLVPARRAGYKPLDLKLIPVRELTPEDFKRLASINMHTKATPLQKVTHRHRSMAMMVAGGHSTADIVATYGITPQRISDLKMDPAFQNLVEHFAQKQEDAFVSLNEKLTAIGSDAADELQRRLNDDEEGLGANLLADLLFKVADRTGHGPQSNQKTEVNVTVGLADRLSAARRASSEAKVINGDSAPVMELYSPSDIIDAVDAAVAKAEAAE